MWRALLYLLSFAAVVLPATRSAAATRIAQGNGDWIAPGTWSGNVLPQAGDLIIIPASVQVNVTTNNNYSGAAMRIQVYGTLQFVGNGAKISMPCGSILEVMTPAALVTGNGSGSSQTIRICGTTHWSVSDGPQSGYTAWPPNSTLPVELLSFTATAVEGGVALAWSTATESNTRHFEVQRSADAVTFTAFTTVPAAGWSAARIDYATLDGPLTSGTWYYRLVQHDLDGITHVFPAVTARIGTTLDFTCSPIPASDRIVCATAHLPAILSVSDISGNIVLQRTLMQEHTTISLMELPNGPYVMHVVHGDRAEAQRILVVHE